MFVFVHTAGVGSTAPVGAVGWGVTICRCSVYQPSQNSSPKAPSTACVPADTPSVAMVAAAEGVESQRIEVWI